MRRVRLVPGLQPALRAERARLLRRRGCGRARASRRAPGPRRRARARRRRAAPRLDAVDDHPLVRLAVGGVREQLVARHQAGHGVGHPQVGELHARAGRERRRVVAGDPARMPAARAVSPRASAISASSRSCSRASAAASGGVRFAIACFGRVDVARPAAIRPPPRARARCRCRRRRLCRGFVGLRRPRGRPRAQGARRAPPGSAPRAKEGRSSGKRRAPRRAGRRGHSWRSGVSLASAAALGEDRPTARVAVRSGDIL